jgi:hypothetical protein
MNCKISVENLSGIFDNTDTSDGLILIKNVKKLKKVFSTEINIIMSKIYVSGLNGEGLRQNICFI